MPEPFKKPLNVSPDHQEQKRRAKNKRPAEEPLCWYPAAATAAFPPLPPQTACSGFRSRIIDDDSDDDYVIVMRPKKKTKKRTGSSSSSCSARQTIFDDSELVLSGDDKKSLALSALCVSDLSLLAKDGNRAEVLAWANKNPQFSDLKAFSLDSASFSGSSALQLEQKTEEEDWLSREIREDEERQARAAVTVPSPHTPPLPPPPPIVNNQQQLPSFLSLAKPSPAIAAVCSRAISSPPQPLNNSCPSPTKYTSLYFKHLVRQ